MSLVHGHRQQEWDFVAASCFSLVAAAACLLVGTAVAGDATDSSWRNRIIMTPIGVIHSPYKETKGTPIQGVFDKDTVAWVELEDRCVPGLQDLASFSHAILLYHFHKSDREEIVGKPYLE
jgi:hypothetical protein